MQFNGGVGLTEHPTEETAFRFCVQSQTAGHHLKLCRPAFDVPVDPQALHFLGSTSHLGA